jgi:hypothetical protein
MVADNYGSGVRQPATTFLAVSRTPVLRGVAGSVTILETFFAQCFCFIVLLGAIKDFFGKGELVLVSIVQLVFFVFRPSQTTLFPQALPPLGLKG